MEWALAIVAFTLVAVAAISGRLSGTPITSAMVFVAVGLGPKVLGELDLESVTFLFFGALLLGPTLGEITWELALYAVLSLTVARMESAPTDVTRFCGPAAHPAEVT